MSEQQQSPIVDGVNTSDNSRDAIESNNSSSSSIPIEGNSSASSHSPTSSPSTTTINAASDTNAAVAPPPAPLTDTDTATSSSSSSTTTNKHIYPKPGEKGGAAPKPNKVYVPSDWELKGAIGHLTPAEEETLGKFREVMKGATCIEIQENVGTFKLDDSTLLRFLRARQFDIKKAEKMLRTHLEFRDKWVPAKIQPTDISSALVTGLVRFGPYTSEGLICTMIKISKFEPYAFESLDQYTRYCCFFFERAVSYLPPGAEKGMLFFDMKGFTLSKHFNRRALQMIQVLIEVIQAHNPERLKKAVLFNSPFIFSSAWAVIKPMLDPVVAEKIFFVKNVKDVAAMFDDLSQLPAEYGGNRVEPFPIEGLEELGLQETSS